MMPPRILIHDTTVLAAMSVIPIGWLTANEIAAEMNIEGDGRTIASTLKELLKKRKIIQCTHKNHPTEYRLSDSMARSAIRKFNQLKPPHSWFGREIPE